ncbi:MAG: methionyl-tRNA formyltransferase [Gammaproteobacteria bacterium]|nr:methionyl-tRNA formyltransferase [Gammaproteobacteria bacterium]
MTHSLRIIFAGTPEFAAEALAAILQTRHKVIAVYTQPDRPAGRGRKLKPSAVKALAQQQQIPIYQPLSLRKPEAEAEFLTLSCDVMVVAAYGLILPPAVLEHPRYGCLNIHASLLPRWRGAAPIQRAILAGDEESGITIMQMDRGLDTGAMVSKKAIPIAAGESAEQLHDRLAQCGGAEIVAALQQLANQGKLEATPQSEREACYAAKLHKEEAVIDWSETSVAISRRIAAFNPWPVAQTQFGEKVLRIWEGSVCDTPHPPGTAPGTVVAADKRGVAVACGEGSLRLTQVQLPGGKPMSAASFRNAHQLDGVRLGTGPE